jgi:hypothetical protein
MPLKFLYDQARKQPKLINSAFKIQKTFHKNDDITNKLLVIIHANKINAKK